MHYQRCFKYTSSIYATIIFTSLFFQPLISVRFLFCWFSPNFFLNYQVSGADGLVVRVVSSVDKKLEVKPRFFEIFQEDKYPAEFPYKSKVRKQCSHLKYKIS